MSQIGGAPRMHTMTRAMSRPSQLARALAAVCLTATLVAACTAGEADDSSYAVDQLTARAHRTLKIRPYDSVADLMPTVSYVEPDGTRRAGTEAMVLGRIIAVEPGRAFTFSEQGRAEVPFTSPKAESRTVHLRVAVAERLGSAPGPKVVTVGLAVGGATDIRRFGDGLRDLGLVLLPLQDAGPVFRYDPTMYSIAEDGDLLMTVSPSGQIDLPALDGGERDALLGSWRTLDDARAAGRAPARSIQLDAAGERQA
jgi:hypothetical protein